MRDATAHHLLTDAQPSLSSGPPSDPHHPVPHRSTGQVKKGQQDTHRTTRSGCHRDNFAVQAFLTRSFPQLPTP